MTIRRLGAPDPIVLEMPEKKEPVEYRPDRGSLAWHLDQLNVGETESVTKRITADDLPLTSTKEVLDGMSSVISSTLTRLQQRVPKRFITERGRWITSSDDVMCTIAITRVE